MEATVHWNKSRANEMAFRWYLRSHRDTYKEERMTTTSWRQLGYSSLALSEWLKKVSWGDQHRYYYCSRPRNYNEWCQVLHGGNISLTKGWAKYIPYRMGLVKRRTSKMAIVNFNKTSKLQVKTTALKWVKCHQISLYKINYVPVSLWILG